MGGGGGEEGRRGGTGVFLEGVKTAVASAAIGIALAAPMLLSLPGVADAADKRMVGEISASGLVFKVTRLCCDEHTYVS